MSGPYPYYGPTGVLDQINQFRLDGRFALIGEDGDHFLKFRERPMTLFVTGRFNVNNHAHVIADSDRCDAKWFYYCFLHKDLFRALTRQGAGRYKLTKAALEKLPIPLPTLEQQRYMIGILDQLGRAGSELQRLCELKRKFKRGLMQQLLTGRKRFPEFLDRPRHLAQIVDFASLVNERMDPKKSSAALRCIELEHIESETGRLLGESTTTKADSIKTVFEEGDVLFGKLRPYLRKFARPRFRGACSTEIWALRPDPAKVHNAFLYHVVDSVPFRRAANAVSGSKMPRADWNVVSEVSVWLPELDEQSRIAALLDAQDSEIELLAAKREKLEVFRRALLSKLLSGSLKVPV